MASTNATEIRAICDELGWNYDDDLDRNLARDLSFFRLVDRRRVVPSTTRPSTGKR
jgi:hypothetical protein